LIWKGHSFQIFSRQIRAVSDSSFKTSGRWIDDKGTVISVTNQPPLMRWPKKLGSDEFGFRIWKRSLLIFFFLRYRAVDGIS